MSTSDRSHRESLAGAMRSVASPFRAYLAELQEKYGSYAEGKVADYIPELAPAKSE